MKDFENDETQVKKDFRNLVSFKTTFVKGNDCREASDLFIEAYNFYKQTSIHGSDSVDNPNELYALRWLLTTVGRGMYQEDPDVLPTVLPIMQHLRVVLEVIDN